VIRLKRGVLVLLVISCVCCIICQWSGVRRRDALEGDQCSTGADNAGQLATADQADVKDAAPDVSLSDYHHHRELLPPPLPHTSYDERE